MEQTEFSYKLLEKEIAHLKELMFQHDKLTEIAINKAEETLNERLSKVNEFREQQKDIIATFATQIETDLAIKGLSERFEQNIKSVTDRAESNIKSVTDKIETLNTHILEKIDGTKKGMEEKRELLYKGVQESFKSISELTATNMKNIQETILANVKVETERLAANAKVSDLGISSLNTWKENTQGSIKVILTVGGFICAVVLALLIAYIYSAFHLK